MLIIFEPPTFRFTMSDSNSIIEEQTIEIEIDDIITSHIEVRDYRMSFVQFIEASRKITVTDQQWTILIALLEACRNIHSASQINADENLREANIQFLEQLELIEGIERGIIGKTRPGAGALLLLELICGITLGVSLIFEDTYKRLKPKNPIPLAELAKKIRKSHETNKALVSRGFGVNRNKSVESLTMLVHPILSEENFPVFLGILSEANHVYCFMNHGYNHEPDYLATVDGYVLEQDQGEAQVLTYYYKDPEEEYEVTAFEDIFAYANSVGINKPRHSNDTFESYFINLQLYLDNIVPLYLNSPLVSKRYRIVCERIDRAYIAHCHANLQDSIVAMVVNKLDDFLTNNEDTSILNTVISRVRSKRISAIKSIGKLIGLPPNWTKILTPSSLQSVIVDFVDVVDYLTLPNTLEEELIEPQVDEDEVLSTNDITIINTALEADCVKPTKLFDSIYLVVDKDKLKDTQSLTLKSVNKLLDQLELTIDFLASKLKGVVTTKTLMQYALTPEVFEGQPYVTPKRFAIFQETLPPIQKYDLEFKVGSATRLFLRDVDDKLEVVFFGNPKYH
jgi:hypothetical protein